MVDTIQKIVAEILNVNPEIISNDLDISTIENWDSLQQVMIIAEIEEQLKISIPIEKINRLHCIQDFIDIIS